MKVQNRMKWRNVTTKYFFLFLIHSYFSFLFLPWRSTTTGRSIRHSNMPTRNHVMRKTSKKLLHSSVFLFSFSQWIPGVYYLTQDLTSLKQCMRKMLMQLPSSIPIGICSMTSSVNKYSSADTYYMLLPVHYNKLQELGMMATPEGHTGTEKQEQGVKL